MVRTVTRNHPPRGNMDEQDNTQLLESDLNDFQPMPKNLFVGGAEQEQSNTSDDERTPTGSMKAAQTTELEERTKVLEMAMGKILSRLIPDDPLIPLLNRGEQSTTVVATRNSSALRTYDGSNDPDEHLHTYQAIMKIQNAIDAMMCKVFPATLKSTARRWSTSFILSEDFQSSKRRVDDKQSKEHKQPEATEEKKKQKVGEQRGKPLSFPRYANYIPLSSSRSQILAQIQHWVKRPPPQTHEYPQADKSKYCDYHRAYGHNTDDCQSLKDELEFLARNGKLEGYVQKPYAQQPREEPDIMMLHADPFVATVHIDNHNVNKVFIDTGTEPRFRMASVSFLVVKMESAYNAIIGRATLCELKAIISQPHLCMKFPTPQGIGVLKGNQKMARACYQDTFKKVELAPMPKTPSLVTRPNQPESGKFLGYVMSKKGIEVNSDKVMAVQQMKPPKTVKDVQRLTGRLAALHRFMARLAERCLPFFRALREPKSFQWTSECQQAFDELKQYLASPPLLSKPIEGERLYLYLGIADEAVNSILLREQDKQQKLICYISKVLQDAERNYPIAEKATFALVYTAQKLRAYFQSHDIIVYTDLPLKKILQKPELSSWLIGWAVELSEYDLKFQPCTAIKGQALANFLVECHPPAEEKTSPAGPIWTLFVDGAASVEGSGAEAVLIDPNGFKSEHALRFSFKTTNNAAEYKALIYGLKLASALKAQHKRVFSDSQLVVKMKANFISFRIDKIPRADNKRANELSKLASSQDINPHRMTVVEILDESSYTDLGDKCLVLSTDPSSLSWTTPLIKYLRNGELPEDPSNARLVRRRAAHFTLINDQLYKRVASMPLLRCLTPYKAEYAMREGFYWPTMVEDAQSYVKKCPTCQFNADDIHMLGQMLSSLTSPWPFAQWGVDLLGPFIKGEGGCTHLIIAVDYFTKWIEAKPLSMTTERKIEEFIFNSILCRFDIPRRIIVDNGPQFRAAALRSFCNDYGIELSLTFVYTPQSNGQAELANKIVLQGLKTCVLAAHSNWVDELNKVLLSCRTTPSSATGETPFSLAYGTEAVLLVEVGLATNQYARLDHPDNEQFLRENLDLVEEVREASRIKNMVYQGHVAKFYNKQINGHGCVSTSWRRDGSSGDGLRCCTVVSVGEARLFPSSSNSSPSKKASSPIGKSSRTHQPLRALSSRDAYAALVLSFGLPQPFLCASKVLIGHCYPLSKSVEVIQSIVSFSLSLLCAIHHTNDLIHGRLDPTLLFGLNLLQTPPSAG
ncbi:hypothetical protein SLEP1_g58152 [Rubroshorea leprosula]|uniref:Integrase catalytic domain-containing protein n=1 Tax=Rubroshorea leprosula TaxID=152421 RepID=A0AAV5MSY9_9ROSI|nr:hypothetical protein SLEP1_g58152 [Rubroshorea leprosula]